MYKWIVAWGRHGTKLDGKRVLFGPFTTELRAREFSDGLPGESTVYDFPTRDRARATRMLKERGVEVNKSNWEEQGARVSHPKTREEA